MSVRPVSRLAVAKPTMEGAGVHLRRVFGFHDTDETDPFLMMDDFRGDDPDLYLAGFPWHPHRGIETITYVTAGSVEHADSIGNKGAIGPGDVQWMTAGRGILHNEMPKPDAAGRMHGFQLWANLPAALKMTAPRYQGVVAADIPTVGDDTGTSAKVICGELWGTRGPVEGVAAHPRYLDVSVPAGVRASLPVDEHSAAFAYVIDGGGHFCNADQPLAVPTEADRWIDTTPPTAAVNRVLVVFGPGDEIRITGGPEGVRFLLISGRPLREPVAWYGPIVMNTQEELRAAFAQLKDGTFFDGGPA